MTQYFYVIFFISEIEDISFIYWLTVVKTDAR
jgi:hypothetical protein